MYALVLITCSKGCYHQHSNRLVCCDCMHAQETIFSVGCYGHACIHGYSECTINYLLRLVPSYMQTRQITKQCVISLQPTTVLLNTLQVLVNLANNQVCLLKLFSQKVIPKWYHCHNSSSITRLRGHQQKFSGLKLTSLTVSCLLHDSGANPPHLRTNTSTLCPKSLHTKRRK